MTMKIRLLTWLQRMLAPPTQPPAPPVKKRRKRTNWDKLLTWASATPAKVDKTPLHTAKPAPGVVPEADLAGLLANDSSPYGYMAENGYSVNEYSFPGYPYLAELSQVNEYRTMGSTLAEEMVREGISIRSSAEGDNSEVITRLTELVREYRVMDTMRRAIELDAWFGRCQIYFDMYKPGSVKELVSQDNVELGTPLALSEKKITRGSFKGLVIVEPMWSYPGIYESVNPLDPTYYRPNTWYVMSKTVHTSRLAMICSRPVPDMLKAAYSFGGISLSQLAQPYVNRWLRTVQSVSDIVHSFSTSGILTDLNVLLAASDDEDSSADLGKRAQLFNLTRDNKGLMFLDKESEEFFQFNASLSSLDKLQAQSQEQMAAPAKMPLVKLLGITPAGLNANSDGEIRVFYDYVASEQERVLRIPLKQTLDVIQLSEFGAIDPNITFVFNPLYQLSESEQATARKTDAETDQILINSGTISAMESRTRLASNPESPYSGLELSADVSEEYLDPANEQDPNAKGEEAGDDEPGNPASNAA